MRKGWVIFSLLTAIHLCVGVAFAERSVGMMFYDLDNLYDTIPSPFYDDRLYTPEGQYRWDTKRYNQKIKNITRAIDSAEMDIVVLYGVESESIVRDIALASSLDYSYIHRSLDYYNGLDFALLYYGDMFHAEHIVANNYYLYIGGELCGQRIALHLTRRGDRLMSLFQPNGAEAEDIQIAWGKLSRKDVERLKMNDMMRNIERRGLGDTKSRNGWYVANRLGVCAEILSSSLSEHVRIYTPNFLLNTSKTEPLPTLSKERYYGGYSKHLPCYFYLLLP